MVGRADMHQLLGVGRGVEQRQKAQCLLNRLLEFTPEYQRCGHITVGDQAIRFTAALSQGTDLQRERVTRRHVPGGPQHDGLQCQRRNEA